MRRLHFGCGPVQPEGWDNLDAENLGQEYVGDFVTGRFEPDAYAYAVGHHCLQMVGYHDLVPALANLRGAIEPGGWLRLGVPDLLGAIDAWRRNEAGYFPIVDEAESQIAGKLCAYLTWYSTARSVFMQAWLAELCVRAGFASASASWYGVTESGIPDLSSLDTRPAETIYVEARR